MIPNVIYSAVQMLAAIGHLTACTKWAIGLNMISNMIQSLISSFWLFLQSWWASQCCASPPSADVIPSGVSHLTARAEWAIGLNMIANVIRSAVQMPAAVGRLTAHTEWAIGLNMIPNVIHSAVQMLAAIGHLTACTKWAVGLDMIPNMIQSLISSFWLVLQSWWASQCCAPPPSADVVPSGVGHQSESKQQVHCTHHCAVARRNNAA
jgi:hypothetical protein